MFAQQFDEHRSDGLVLNMKTRGQFLGQLFGVGKLERVGQRKEHRVVLGLGQQLAQQLLGLRQGGAGAIGLDDAVEQHLHGGHGGPFDAVEEGARPFVGSRPFQLDAVASMVVQVADLSPGVGPDGKGAFGPHSRHDVAHSHHCCCLLAVCQRS